MESQSKQHEADVASLMKSHDHNMQQAKAVWVKEKEHLHKQFELDKERVSWSTTWLIFPFIQWVPITQAQSEKDKQLIHDVDMLKKELFIASGHQAEVEARHVALDQERQRLLEEMRY